MSDLQWSGLDQGVAGYTKKSGMASLGRNNYDNTPFKFPGSTRLDFESGEKYKVQRGFMRSLLGEMSDLKDKNIINNSRFFFQFNPERIMRSVSVSSGLMNPLLQDSGQFSIATPGNATFSFDILLNREMEVNQASLLVRSATFDATSGQPMSFNFKSPGRIGVLSDLLIMDGIIGQGITDNTIEALAKLQSMSTSWDTSDTSSGASAGDTTSTFIPLDTAKAAFSSIMGNSAFLVSTPVRIVFSELFMVDGFIQGSAVNFTKFSKDMIPTMCAINVTVEAKYIGFAKKDTYLTKSLYEAGQNTVVTTPETTVEGPGSAVLRAAIKELGDYQIAVGGTSKDRRPVGWYESAHDGGTSAGYQDIWNQMDYEEFYLRFGFFEAVTLADKGISKLFYENKPLKFSHQPTVRLWREFTPSELAAWKINNKTNTGGSRGPGSYGIVGGVKVRRDVLLLEIVGAEAVANDFISWRKFKAYGDGSLPFNDGRSYSRDDVDNYIKQANSVFINGTKNKALAENLYLVGIDAKKNNKNDNPLLLEVDLTITAELTTAAAGYSPQYSAAIPVPVKSSINFTQNFLHIMKPTDVLFKRFKVVEKKAK